MSDLQHFTCEVLQNWPSLCDTLTPESHLTAVCSLEIVGVVQEFNRDAAMGGDSIQLTANLLYNLIHLVHPFEVHGPLHPLGTQSCPWSLRVVLWVSQVAIEHEPALFTWWVLHKALQGLPCRRAPGP